MNNQKLEIKAAIQVSKPANEVFEAIVNPDEMTNYFISKSTGRMEEGKDLIWNFPEFGGDSSITVGKIEKDKYISFYWGRNNEQLVEINLEPYKGKATVVTVTEKSKDNDEAGIKWLKSNTEGWANFLACLKAWMEYRIHLREGAFEFMFDKKE
jgi:uncharacterized protein YndB with AHSA1/START domain